MDKSRYYYKCILFVYQYIHWHQSTNLSIYLPIYLLSKLEEKICVPGLRISAINEVEGINRKSQEGHCRQVCILEI